MYISRFFVYFTCPTQKHFNKLISILQKSVNEPFLVSSKTLLCISCQDCKIDRNILKNIVQKICQGKYSGMTSWYTKNLSPASHFSKCKIFPQNQDICSLKHSRNSHLPCYQCNNSPPVGIELRPSAY